MRSIRVTTLALALCLGVAPAAERVTITLLATTDLHGNVYPIDYFRNQPAARGLAKIATLVREARAANPHSLLIDCGDTIQGTPAEYLYQHYVRTGHLPLGLTPPEHFQISPTVLAMNLIGYDALVLGNHDFNYGLRCLDKARADSRFPWLSANTVAEPGSGRQPFAPYVLKTVAGVKIAIVGVTTPAIPVWEQPRNYRGYRFESPIDSVERALAALRAESPDVTIVAAHSGLGRDLKTGAAHTGSTPGESFVYDLATRVAGIDAIVFGHSHQELAGARIGRALVVQPRNGGTSLARLDFVLKRAGNRWKLLDKSSRLAPVRPGTQADEQILAAARPYHDLAQRYLSSVVTQTRQTLKAELGRVEDTALLDAIHQVQLHYAKADVSFGSMFNTRMVAPQGPVTVRQIAALYVYDNELFALEGTGKLVKDALENAARCFVSCRASACSQPPLINSKVVGYNCDTAQGVEYEIDLTRPEGDRIRNLRWKGRPLQPDQKLRIAVNSYRAGGSAGYGMFRDAPVAWRSSEDIRQLIIDYYSGSRPLPEQPDGNWRILPETARETLRREVTGAP